MKLSEILLEDDHKRRWQARDEARAVHSGKTDSITNGVFKLERKTDKDGQERFVMTGAKSGEHSLFADPSITSLNRLYSHWLGYQKIPQQ